MPMHPGMKMLMLNKVTQHPESNYRSEYGGTTERRMIGYDRDYNTENRRRYMDDGRMNYGMDEPESRRRRDSRGRYMEGEGWEDNRNYPRSNYETESRRRRDSRGRYMMDERMDDDDDDEIEMRGQTWYPPTGRYMPPNMHGGSKYGFGDVYAEIHAPGAMNRPGMMGGDMSAPVDEHTARMWVQKMDGGEKFKPEQTEQFRATHCPDCSKWEYYVALNAMYSDHCDTAKRMGMDKPEFYAMLARDFLMDKDAGPHKLRKYMETIPK